MASNIPEEYTDAAVGLIRIQPLIRDQDTQYGVRSTSRFLEGILWQSMTTGDCDSARKE